MNYKEKIIVLLIILCLKLAYSQEKITFYFREVHYADKMYILNRSERLSMIREYESENRFKEKGLGLMDRKFKVENNIWYLRRKGKWIEFFNQGKEVPYIWKITGMRYSLYWEKTKLEHRDEEVFVLKLKPIGFELLSGKVEYYFTPQDGFIGINTHDGIYIRTDKLEN